MSMKLLYLKEGLSDIQTCSAVGVFQDRASYLMHRDTAPSCAGKSENVEKGQIIFLCLLSYTTVEIRHQNVLPERIKNIEKRPQAVDLLCNVVVYILSTLRRSVSKWPSGLAGI